MPVICIGPVCVPTNLVVPFAIGVAHRYGYLQFLRTEWFTFKYWRRQVRWLIWSIVKSRIVKWWRGDTTPDSLDCPPAEGGEDAEAKQAEQAATDVTQEPNAGPSTASVRQPPGQTTPAHTGVTTRSAGQTSSPAKQTAAGSGSGAGSSTGPAKSAKSKAATTKAQPSSWASWFGGGKTPKSQ